MPKLVEITVRRFPYAGKMLGAPGQYEFDNATARKLVKDGKGKIVKDLGDDDSTLESKSSSGMTTEEFLGFIQDNAVEILDILETANQIRMENRQQDEENAENSQTKGTSSDDSKTDQDKTSNAGDGKSDETKTETNDSEEDEAKGTPIPDRFPSKEKLEEAGFKTLESIPRNKEELEKSGLSERSAKAVEGRLTELLGE